MHGTPKLTSYQKVRRCQVMKFGCTKNDLLYSNSNDVYTMITFIYSSATEQQRSFMSDWFIPPREGKEEPFHHNRLSAKQWCQQGCWKSMASQSSRQIKRTGGHFGKQLPMDRTVTSSWLCWTCLRLMSWNVIMLVVWEGKKTHLQCWKEPILDSDHRVKAYIGEGDLWCYVLQGGKEPSGRQDLLCAHVRNWCVHSNNKNESLLRNAGKAWFTRQDYLLTNYVASHLAVGDCFWKFLKTLRHALFKIRLAAELKHTVNPLIIDIFDKRNGHQKELSI